MQDPNLKYFNFIIDFISVCIEMANRREGCVSEHLYTLLLEQGTLCNLSEGSVCSHPK